MTSFHGVTSVCTALHMNGLGSMDNWATNTKLDWLKNQIPGRIASALGRRVDNYHSAFNGYALVFAISTREQKCEKTMERLGFTKCFEAKKSHKSSRELQSGALTMWCVQPWVLEENRQKFIAELEAGDKPTAEEIARRQSLEEFQILQYQKSEIMIPLLEAENKKKLYRKDLVPLNMNVRNRLFQLVYSLTGGFTPQQDPVLLPLISSRTLTWGDLKDRAIKWRNGEFK